MITTDMQVAMEKTLSFPYDAFLMVRLEFVLITNDELKAKILRIIENYTNLERQRLYQEMVNKPGFQPPEDGIIRIPRQVWVSISHRLFLNDLYNLVKSENTLKKAIEGLVDQHLIFRRFDPKQKYDAAEYQLNIGALDFLFLVMGSPGGQKLIPSISEGIKNLDHQKLIPSEYQKLIPSDFILSVGRVSKIDPHIIYSNKKNSNKKCVLPQKPKRTRLEPSPPENTHTFPPSPSKTLELTTNGKRVVGFYQKLRKKPMSTERIIKAANTLGENDEVNEENMLIVLEQLDSDPWFKKNPQAHPDLYFICERWDTCLEAGRRQREERQAEEAARGNDEETTFQQWQTWIQQVERGEIDIQSFVESNFRPHIFAIFPAHIQQRIRENSTRKETVLCTT